MQDVIGERHQNDVGAHHPRHHDGVRDAQREHQRLLLEVGEAFLHVRVDGEREPCFGDFWIHSGFERLGSCFRCFAILPRIFLALPRRNVPAAHLIQAVGRHKISRAIDGQNSRDSRGVIEEADEGPSDEHAAVLVGVLRGMLIAGAFVGFLYNTAGIAGILAIDGATYFVSAYCLYQVRRGYVSPRESQKYPREYNEATEATAEALETGVNPEVAEAGLSLAIYADMKEGFVYLKQQPLV